MSSLRRNGLALVVLLVRASFAVPYLRPTTTGLGNNEETEGSPKFWYHLTISVLLVLMGGLFAG
jgi:metal transporter CNNM